MFYTYAYLREDGTPYYIGKGTGYRINDRKKNVPIPPRERRLLLKTFDNEKDAFKHEIYMINLYGRKDIGTGILRNLTDGGEGTINVVRSQEHLNALHEGRKSIYTEEHSKKISETLKAKNIKPPLQNGKKWCARRRACVSGSELTFSQWSVPYMYVSIQLTFS